MSRRNTTKSIMELQAYGAISYFRNPLFAVSHFLSSSKTHSFGPTSFSYYNRVAFFISLSFAHTYLECQTRLTRWISWCIVLATLLIQYFWLFDKRVFRQKEIHERSNQAIRQRTIQHDSTIMVNKNALSILSNNGLRDCNFSRCLVKRQFS